MGSLVIIALLPLADSVRSGRTWSYGTLEKATLAVFIAVVATTAFYYLLTRVGNFIDANAAAQAHFLDGLNLKYVDVAILFSAALSLFFEFGIIRWQSTIFEFFAFYKNFSPLACFLGLGLGYALATRDRIPLSTVIPLLAWQFGFMIFVRFGPGTPFRTIPFREQLTMGIGAADLTHIVALYALLTVVFALTALTFIPVGQLCGRLMERRPKLRAYGLNLLGSLLGVLLMLLLSFLWVPPLVWFGLCFLAILLFHSRTPSSLTVGTICAVLCTIALAWPVDPLWDRVYSQYQLLEIGHSDDTGLTLIRAADHYYQRIYDFSEDRVSTQAKAVRTYYDFPYKAHPPTRGRRGSRFWNR